MAAGSPVWKAGYEESGGSASFIVGAYGFVVARNGLPRRLDGHRAKKDIRTGEPT
ncbi:hypothetical protein [Kutzneria buriramensis]|uniref:Uncharacterized protein n=1 Tax=Kutzneria buriramensis TaxID=1045776 RepID=A0A3E0GZ70_9PSEU|nr:hypothetical protein [Kutzneria buriramensis]REH35635.1 hypothetical protein BCF44_11723 [Kutzneria buriramensis]